jgi:hypothetical protein
MTPIASFALAVLSMLLAVCGLPTLNILPLWFVQVISWIKRNAT